MYHIYAIFSVKYVISSTSRQFSRNGRARVINAMAIIEESGNALYHVLISVSIIITPYTVISVRRSHSVRIGVRVVW